MNLMGTRLTHLAATMAGYLKTGIPLIEWDGSRLLLTNTGDDIGVYIIIPKLAYFFHLSLERAITIFFSSLLILPMIISIIFFCIAYKKISQRIVSISCVILLTRFAYAIGDVYLSFSAAALILIPWSLIICELKSLKWSIFFGVFSGISVSFFHYIRSFSGVGALLCIFTFMMGSRTHSKMSKAYFVLALAAGLFVPHLYFNAQYKKAKEYARAELGESCSIESNHVFWHPLYLGFGFLNFKNSKNIRYDDAVGLQTALAVNPNVVYCSKEYEEILKNEVLLIAKNDWVFLILTLFAKLGILIFYLLKFANIGLLAAFVCRKPWSIDGGFFLALCWNSIFSLLAIPLHEYALGFISCATLWGIVSINNMLSALPRFSFQQKKCFNV
ncbi:MAG TPA: hypothetical protein VHO47_05705 [Candidatus Babeliales bacterium]|nr:hypothetical protein [Candidatus Babeliales bacterium]